LSTYQLDDAVVTILEQGTGKQIGLVAVPAEFPSLPYAILDPSSKAQPAGDMGSITNNRDIKYVVRCYGQDPRQVRWMENKVEQAMLGGVSALGAQWVLPESSGAIVPDGAELYSSVSTFCVRM
jgi:hypothetical protein